jgi:hypothetical protein
MGLAQSQNQGKNALTIGIILGAAGTYLKKGFLRSRGGFPACSAFLIPRIAGLSLS